MIHNNPPMSQNNDLKARVWEPIALERIRVCKHRFTALFNHIDVVNTIRSD